MSHERLHRDSGRRRALALVVVLWVIVILVVIVATIGKTARLDSRVGMATQTRQLGRWACRAGVERAIALLGDDTRDADSLSDVWADNPEDCNDIELGAALLSVRIVDEAGKLNINTASRDQLLLLPDMTDEIADAIIDWRDKDDDPGTSGAEAGYYINLPIGYDIRNGPMVTIRELLMVRDVTRELLYAEDVNLNGELDRNENDEETTWPLDDGDGVLDEGWMAWLTCYSYDKNVDAEGADRVNINSASESDLEQKLNIRKSQAKWVVQQRNNKAFESIADLINENSPKEPTKDESEDPEPIDMTTFGQIVDRIAINDDKKVPGRVNINTAPRDVLIALLEDSQEKADEIMTYRESLATGMTSIAELSNVKSIDIKTFKKIAQGITTRGNVFTVRCSATAGKTRARSGSEVVVDRGGQDVAVLYRYEGVNY